MARFKQENSEEKKLELDATKCVDEILSVA